MVTNLRCGVRLASEYRAGIFALTGICGLIDVACFVAIGGVFAELMTGNLLLMGINVGTHSFAWSQAAMYFAAIGPFLLGAFIAGLMSSGRFPLGVRLIGYPVEYACVLVATLVAVVVNPPQLANMGQFTPSDGYQWQRMTIIGILAFGMGIHNAIMRKHGVPDIATNVMTLTLTGLVSESRVAGGPSTHWERRLASILIFIFGAILGAWLLRYGVAAPLVAASIVFTFALWPLMRGRSEEARVADYKSVRST